MGKCDDSFYSFCMLPDETPGLKKGKSHELGCSPSASWSMDNARVPADHACATTKWVDGDFGENGADLFSLSVSAMALGSMGAALDDTIEYLTVRENNFKPVITIPSIQQKIAMMKAKEEACRSMVIKATDLLLCSA